MPTIYDVLDKMPPRLPREMGHAGKNPRFYEPETSGPYCPLQALTNLAVAGRESRHVEYFVVVTHPNYMGVSGGYILARAGVMWEEDPHTGEDRIALYTDVNAPKVISRIKSSIPFSPKDSRAAVELPASFRDLVAAVARYVQEEGPDRVLLARVTAYLPQLVSEVPHEN